MSKSVIEKFRKFLSKRERERLLKRDKLHKILRKMRKRQKELEERLDECEDARERKRLQGQIRLLKEQRRKGLAVLADLRQLARQADSYQSR
ncbi:MAG: hypothetical protein ACLFSC_01805 [Wenzhouxiangella sp.]